MLTVTAQELEALSDEAAQAPRRRRNRNLHAELADPVQRMINLGHPDSYVRPHRHDGDRWETFSLLQGAVAVLCFDDDGRVSERVELRPGGTLVAEIAGGVWHAIAFLEPGSAVFEIKPGPYRPASDKDFAVWAPNEGEPGAAELQQWYQTAQPGDHPPSLQAIA